ncbi:MAG: ABC transporter ATP-binding protein [Desulfobacteraceae bacterium]|nr:ABC transporter ATP-binding protein [Desulfobacteraceae bacterium]
MNNHHIISATDLNKDFDSLQVVKGVNLDVNKGEFVAIVGKSGSGKTTLLSLLSGLERPSSGRVILDGRDITDSSENELALFRRDTVGFVFQSFHLIPTLSAWENVALPLFPVKISAEKRRERALELLRQMEMEHRAEHRPSTLSGGEKQRVAIARALINNPKIVFADEPTGNLDSATTDAILEILKCLHADNGLSLVMVTHDLDLAESSDRIIRMQDGEVLS